MFIVQGKPRSPEGILKVIKQTRHEAMQAAYDLLEGGMAFVTIIAEGRVYTVEEFALTILDPHKVRDPKPCSAWCLLRRRETDVVGKVGR
jgi:hypothetical protein